MNEQRQEVQAALAEMREVEGARKMHRFVNNTLRMAADDEVLELCKHLAFLVRGLGVQGALQLLAAIGYETS